MYLTDTTTDKSYVIKVPLKRSNILIFKVTNVVKLWFYNCTVLKNRTWTEKIWILELETEIDFEPK